MVWKIVEYVARKIIYIFYQQIYNDVEKEKFKEKKWKKSCLLVASY